MLPGESTTVPCACPCAVGEDADVRPRCHLGVAARTVPKPARIPPVILPTIVISVLLFMADPPLITANFAISADGKVAPGRNTGSGFGSARDKERLLSLRETSDALVVGRGTLVADNMGMGGGFARVIAGFRGFPPADLKVFTTPGGPVHVLTGKDAQENARVALGDLATIHPIDSPADLPESLVALARDQGWCHVHCEGGPTLFRQLLSDGLVDKLHLTIVPVLFGNHDAPTLLGGPLTDPLPASIPLRLATSEFVEGEAFLTYERVA